jgi:hypothetical protein
MLVIGIPAFKFIKTNMSLKVIKLYNSKLNSKTLTMIKKSVSNFKQGKVSKPIKIGKYVEFSGLKLNYSRRKQ